MELISLTSIREATLLTASNVLRLLGLWIAYRLTIALYNISPFHPLHKFPGPRRAACSYLYEAYYDFWLKGRYGQRIQQMHDKYGPIMRINPDELHCADPDMLDEIYASGGRIRDKWQHFINTGSGPIEVGSFSTVPHELHRMRKGAMARFFSRAQMLILENEVHDYTQRAIDKMLRHAEAYNCFTADIISQYAFGESMGFTDQDGFEPNFGTWVRSFLDSAYMVRYVPGIKAMTKLLPHFAAYMGQDMRDLMHQLNVEIPRHVRRATAEKENGRLFTDLVESPMLSESDKSMYRLVGEGFSVLTGGTETTASTLACITYYLLAKRDLLSRLQADLKGVDPMNLKWIDLEQRPYVWSVIHEALRVMPGLAHRSARVAREEELVYDSGDVRFVIPRGTPVSMTSIIQHRNTTLFPEPLEFKPERWLLPDGKPNYALERRLMAFGRGTRMCLGLHLAYCELYLMTAALTLRLLPRARLVNTTPEDIEYDHDAVVSTPKKGSVAVRIAIT
ncbi:cytochrome P450 monooxygenase-like protein [Xylariomycetidae sp. FL2044]|nr:cytochrome P450 monooxygenase-like protein [Xylariomycetidae sp. FL2044]